MLQTDTSNIWKIFRLSERRGANLGVVVEADRSYLERPVGRRGRKRETHTHTAGTMDPVRQAKKD